VVEKMQVKLFVEAGFEGICQRDIWPKRGIALCIGKFSFDYIVNKFGGFFAPCIIGVVKHGVDIISPGADLAMHWP
jgi:hypothetical protein